MIEFARKTMKLYEFEGQNILKKVGIEVPFFVVISSYQEAKQARKRLKFPIVAKVQVLAGGRGKGGGVKVVRNQKQLLAFIRQHIGRKFGGEEVRFLVLAQKVDIRREYYISITYDTATKAPFILFSEEGGVDIEEVKKSDPRAIVRVDIDPSIGPKEKDLKKILSRTYSSSPSTVAWDKLDLRSQESLPRVVPRGSRLRSNDKNGLIDFVFRLWDAFGRFDCRLCEINPLVLTESGKLVVVDAKVILDDAGLVRHRDLDVLPKGAVGAVPSEREILAKRIDETDYRGTAGSIFIELGGDIAVLASGGGASLLMMDALSAFGGAPANYTEYSGNPPAEKVEKLTKITLSQEGLSGCLVAGAVANFTDIYETLSGFIEGLGQVKPKPLYPIVIRRGGPRQKEAYEMLTKFAKKEDYDIHLFGPETPISVACQKMVELAEQFKSEKS